MAMADHTLHDSVRKDIIAEYGVELANLPLRLEPTIQVRRAGARRAVLSGDDEGAETALGGVGAAYRPQGGGIHAFALIFRSRGPR